MVHHVLLNQNYIILIQKQVVLKCLFLFTSENLRNVAFYLHQNREMIHSIKVAPKETKRKTKFSWTRRHFEPTIYEFDNQNSGIKTNISRKSSILEVFQTFFSEELIEYIVEQTNKSFENNTRGDIHSTKATTVPEIYIFLAINMLMGRIHKISLSEYWCKDKLIRTESFREIMSRDRYTLLLKNLRFYDNNIMNHDPIMKRRYIVEQLRTSFKSAFYPFEKLCIDESLLKFKGRCYFKQFVPSKRSRFGIKSFVLCDIQTGYIQDLLVYSGANMIISEDIPSKSIGKSGQIVMTLLKPYLGRGHTLDPSWIIGIAVPLYFSNYIKTSKPNQRVRNGTKK
ncbi:hypothetical protein KPH14_000941 [Odynerus spinipes]|uniref:PiggyBac transposable element-derived protein domain-containing protein n=1 Tax=Odynerus spinipes TaxID=1348599 RepID=A0AAD9VKS5_9HYME|nr:hypothetical protein KPH14_000941 [Odynerus spinipes]